MATATQPIKLDPARRKALEQDAAKRITDMSDAELCQFCGIDSTGMDGHRELTNNYAERATRAGLFKPDATGVDAELGKVARFAYGHEAELRKIGKRPSEMCHTFQEARKRRPDLTAAGFLGAAAVGQAVAS
jgi:hypothetical protein